MSNGHRSRGMPAESSEAPAGNANPKRMKEDQDIAQRKLTDKHFNIRRYPDPLAPRPSSDPQYFPAGVTVEMEKKWLARIKAFQEKA